MVYPGARALWVCAIIGASACSEAPDAANEAPVDPVPGRYEISQSGKMFGMTGRNDNKKPASMCVKPYEAANFPYKLAEAYAGLSPACTKKRDPRQGNVITGAVSCPADQKMAAGMNDFAYDGKIAPEKISVSIQIKFNAELLEGKMSEAEIKQLKLGMKAMEHARLIIEATRVGDC
ncbi:MAG: DUF3617 family protein [Parvularculaceae bacterium]